MTVVKEASGMFIPHASILAKKKVVKLDARIIGYKSLESPIDALIKRKDVSSHSLSAASSSVLANPIMKGTCFSNHVPEQVCECLPKLCPASIWIRISCLMVYTDQPSP